MRFFFSNNKNKVANSTVKKSRNSGSFCNVYAVSETGPVRDHNEDYIAYSYPENNQRNLIAIVADGMGGHNAGEVASKMACDILLEYCLKYWAKHAPLKLLQKAFYNAHKEIVETGERNTEQQGMGTTATSVIIQQNICYIGHIGDSRIYFFRNGSLTQISKDHTLVNQMFEDGDITKQERDNHPMKNVLLQALGTKTNIQPQITSKRYKVLEGDRIFLCSDGVTDVFSDDDIKDLLSMHQAEFVLECLSCTAITRNVSDNFSALLIEVSSINKRNPSKTKEQNVIL
ncbi:PP2C family protein-serine/threonine phosphatase [Aequorivita sediminis]|uniref:PP2C family protein-serine/threonine phosphatase n=1 Tax=Aequorivita sediminis TaxID=3073653 RepID=UPI0028AF95DB|nr:protein phosphatase 2C domain-containing protein [Aequorivita sp. F6058]